MSALMSIMQRSVALLFRDTHDFWVFFNIATRFVTKIITVGLLVKFLSESDLAAWYIFVALFGLSAILEGGATLAITRQVADHLSTKKQATSFFIIGILKAYKYLVMVVAIVALVFGLWWLSIADSVHTTTWGFAASFGSVGVFVSLFPSQQKSFESFLSRY